jgi:hypothetical protein
MLNKLQHRCWSDSSPFKIDDINFVGYFANSLTEHKRLEGMITIEYHHHIPLEQDLHVVLLLPIHMGNDIPAGEAGRGLKWCPIRNELAHTSCTVTRVSVRRSTRGHCRQDIPLGIYDRKQQRWTLPQSPPTSPQTSPHKEPGNTQSTTPDWRTLIWSVLSEDRPVGTTTVRSHITGELDQGPHEPVLQHDLSTRRDHSVALQLLHMLSSDPRGQSDTHIFFKELEEQGLVPLAQEGRTVLRNAINSTGENVTRDFQ